MNRPITVAVALLVACSVLVPATFATGVAASEHEIDSCTVLDEPGEYEFAEDVETDETDSCIQIQADNVTIDGNGHVLAGPGADSNATGFEIDNGVRGVTIRNVEVAGWERGLDSIGQYVMEDAVVRDNEYGLYNEKGVRNYLRNSTVEGNDIGVYAQTSSVSGTDVTIRDNGDGIFGMDSNYDLEDFRVVDNEGWGIQIQHGSSVTLNDSTVSGNDGHGIYFPREGSSVNGYVENTTVSDNGGDGIRAPSDTYDPIQLVDVTVEGNDGHEVNAAPTDEHLDSADENAAITADGLRVGPSATTAFEEEEAIRLEPVDRESLPDRENGTAAGDGLNVSGNVTGPIDLELDVDTDDETVDLWRHDGSDWETVEEDLAVSDGSIEATVDDPGVYAPGTEADDSQDDTGDDDSDESDDTGDDSGDSDDSDDSQDDADDEDDTGDDTEDDSEPSDDDGEKDDEKSSGSNCGCPDPGSDDAGEDDDSSTDDTEDDTGADDESTSGGETTDSPEDHEQQADDDTETTDDDGSQGDGPGFGAVAALVALLAGVLVIRRRV